MINKKSDKKGILALYRLYTPLFKSERGKNRKEKKSGYKPVHINLQNVPTTRITTKCIKKYAVL